MQVQTMARRFRLARKAAGLTGEEVAERLGVSRVYISQLENGRRSNVHPSLVTSAAILFRVSPAYLLGFPVSGLLEVIIQLAQKGWLDRPALMEIERVLNSEIDRLNIRGIMDERLRRLELAPDLPLHPRTEPEMFQANNPEPEE